MSNNVGFKKETIDLVNKLCAIQPSVIFEKSPDGNELIVNRTNTSTTIAYKLRAPVSHFNFEGQELAIANFPEFSGFLSVFPNPVITQVKENNREKFIINGDNKAKINYLFSDPDTMKRGPKKIPWDGGDVTVKLSSSDVKDLSRAINLVQAEKIKFSVEPGEDLNVILTRGSNDNSFERIFPVVDSAKAKLNITIESDLFTHLPDADYLLEITQTGLVRVSFSKDDVSLELFTAEVEGD